MAISRSLFIAAVSSVILAWLTSLAAAQANVWPRAMLDDADLHDIKFVDATHGWAVGDRGVIWHSRDGGRSWAMQPSGVICPLWAVDFVDRAHGWAVGGEALPYLHRGRGIVLSTQDGGETWQAMPRSTISTLFEVSFSDRLQGSAIGAPSPLFPGGFFATRDGGRVWSGVPTTDRGAQASWSTSNTLQAISNSGRAPSATEFRWHAAANSDDRVWIGGSPGTRVFRSDDAGRSWQSFKTGQTLPLRSLHFVDRQRGWAAGALGLILATTDGGATWVAQRASDRRVAALVICSQVEAIPWVEIAAMAAVDGYRTHVLVVTRESGERPFVVDAEARLREAIAAEGAHSATWWQEFVTPPRDANVSTNAILADWNAEHGAQGFAVRGIDFLAQRLTAAIRMWRPEVVYFTTVENTAGIGSADPSNHLSENGPDKRSIDDLIGIALEAAMEASAGAGYFPELCTRASLPVWRPGAMSALVGQTSGGVGNHGHRLSMALGSSTSELAQAAAALIQDRPGNLPTFRALSASGAPTRLTHGLRADLGTSARREAIELGTGNLEQIASRAQRIRNLETLVRRLTAEKAEVQTTQIVGLASQQSPTVAARIVARMATELEDLGEWQAALESWQLIRQRYPESKLAELAWLRQWQHTTSAEIAARRRIKPARSHHRGVVAQAVARSPPQSNVRTVAAWAAAPMPHQADLLQTMPISLRGDPAIDFVRYRGVAPHRSVQRDRIWKRLLRTSNSDRWRRCAEGELALADPSRAAEKPMVELTSGPRPIIDGYLSDPIWQQASEIVLQNDSVRRALRQPSQKCVLRLARDAEHLYFAISAEKLPGVEYEVSPTTRQRDADLSARDRVQLFFDVDRDYQTGWTLEVDHRGWGAEAICEDRQWDPQWYIAATQEEEKWVVEAAIPLDQLGGDGANQDAWGFGARRVMPTSASCDLAGWPPNLPAAWRWTDLGYLRLSVTRSLDR